MGAKHSPYVHSDSGRSYREALLPRWHRGAASTSCSILEKLNLVFARQSSWALASVQKSPGPSRWLPLLCFVHEKELFLRKTNLFFYLLVPHTTHVASHGILQKALGSCHGVALVAVTIVTFLREQRQIDETDHTSLRTRFTLRTPDTPCRQKRVWPVLYRETGFVYMLSLSGGFGPQSLLYLICFYFIWVFFLNREIGASDWLLKEKCLFSIFFLPQSLLSLFLPFPLLVHSLWVSCRDACESTADCWIPFLSMIHDGSVPYIGKLNKILPVRLKFHGILHLSTSLDFI